jgi:tRNA(Arg) A34 adenosine deaminase TadA
MFSQPAALTIELPPWVASFARAYVASADIEQRMAFVIDAAQRAVDEQSGGPFAAAVFEQESGALVALGVNLVTTQRMSMLHAEMVAIAVAQTRLGTYDLGAASLPRHELVTSTEPCAMCLGAIPWCGVTRVITAARDEDARRIGFDEGAKPDSWQAALQQRGIAVVTDVRRDAARAVLEGYAASGGRIYRSREG